MLKKFKKVVTYSTKTDEQTVKVSGSVPKAKMVRFNIVQREINQLFSPTIIFFQCHVVFW